MPPDAPTPILAIAPGDKPGEEMTSAVSTGFREVLLLLGVDVELPLRITDELADSVTCVSDGTGVNFDTVYVVDAGVWSGMTRTTEHGGARNFVN
jgi:hypothetical protein